MALVCRTRQSFTTSTSQLCVRTTIPRWFLDSELSPANDMRKAAMKRFGQEPKSSLLCLTQVLAKNYSNGPIHNVLGALAQTWQQRMTLAVVEILLGNGPFCTICCRLVVGRQITGVMITFVLAFASTFPIRLLDQAQTLTLSAHASSPISSREKQRPLHGAALAFPSVHHPRLKTDPRT